jgi:hypothetical protein
MAARRNPRTEVAFAVAAIDGRSPEVVAHVTLDASELTEA